MLSFNRFQLHALTQQNVDSKDTRTRILILAKCHFLQSIPALIKKYKIS
uniref:Uncharacterized protein n=1 Tax=Anguilla anguilla TaxID=7936 RepID=A0A0E9T8B0_ANGAN